MAYCAVIFAGSFMKSSWLIKNATILDRNSAFNGLSLDVHIHHGVIADIGKNLSPSSKVKIIDESDLYLTPGWFDLRSSAPDPGLAMAESIPSLLESARLGGYTAIMYMPTEESADRVSVLHYIHSAAASSGVKLHTAASYSEGRKGKQMSEMFDLQQHGALAFSDFDVLASNDLLSRVMEYARDFSSRIFLFPMEVFPGGQIHEGKTSVALGLRGMPSWQETLAVQRIITLSRYYDASVHIELVSCEQSVDLIRAAKKSGARITCGVSPLHLLFTEDHLASFDSNLKLTPPLRSSEDCKALIKGLRDGTIDVIASNHTPVDAEHKQCEFDLSDFGAIGLQHAFLTAMNAVGKHLSVSDLSEKFSIAPYLVLGKNPPVIATGVSAQLSCFSTSGQTKILPHQLASFSRNTPLLESALDGRVFPLVD
jgi:dihydroorotase